jgi:amidohydrolase
LSGTVRLFSRTAQDEVERHMREILDGVSRAAGGSYTLPYTRQAPLNVSDPSLVRSLLPTLLRILGQEHVVVPPPWMAADDFAYLAAEVPAFFFALGTVKPGYEVRQQPYAHVPRGRRRIVRRDARRGAYGVGLPSQ